MKKICLLLIFLQSTPRGTTQAHDPVVVVRYPRSGIVKEGEKFTLQCPYIKKYIYWFKDRKQLHGFSNEFYESRAHSRSGGSYQCGAWTPTWRKTEPLEVVTIAHDKILTLEVKPRAALRGQSIFLKCLVSHWVGGRSHVFLWYRNEKLITPTDESECTIENAQDSDEASYRCELKIGYRKWVSPEVDVTITELFSRVTLRADPQAKIFEGQQLKLVCSVETSRPNILLQYTFFKNDQPLNFDSYENDYRTELASLSDSGTYLCEANALLIGVKKKSDQVSVSVKQLFSRVTLRAEPQAQIFEGQQLKLVCSVETLRPNTRLQYSFYKNEQPLNFTSYQNYYRTELASLSDSGTYLCEANALDIGVKKKSDQVSVSVKQIPVSKPQLSISPGKELIEGGTAALTCSVSNGSTPITYIFYKDSNQEFHLEKSDRKGIIYQIAKVNKSTKGNYSCAVSNEGAEFGLHSEFVAVAVIVPVAGAFLTSNTNKTEISAGFRLVLRCLVTEGTEPRFHWYLNDRQLENISESYHLNADGSELIINSFEISHGGRYHCVATNRGKEVGIFNTTSNHIDVTVLVQSHTTAITASVVPLLLIAVLIALVFFKLRNKKQDNSSRISQPQGEGTGIGAQSLSGEIPAANSEYAVVGSARNTDNTKPAADLVYSVVMIKKATDVDKDVGVAGWKQENKNDPNDYYITYATLKHANTEVSFEGGQMEEEDDRDANVYENLPRK